MNKGQLFGLRREAQRHAALGFRGAVGGPSHSDIAQRSGGARLLTSRGQRVIGSPSGSRVRSPHPQSASAGGAGGQKETPPSLTHRLGEPPTAFRRVGNRFCKSAMAFRRVENRFWKSTMAFRRIGNRFCKSTMAFRRVGNRFCKSTMAFRRVGRH